MLIKIEDAVKGVLAGNRRSIAKAITIVENDTAETQKLVAKIFPHTGKARIIGVTGASGSGKSTLIEKIVREFRQNDKTVGVVAVDPTSPFTGGAFLGDRIRMQRLYTDKDVFIRSMATRNYAGGIAKATKYAVKILDAAGKDIIIIETVGAGQSDVEIIKVAQTVVVVHAPGLGDEIQAIKAGIMEIADIFVVNKADRENANKTIMDIQANLRMNNKERAWRPPVLGTVATTGEGIKDLVEALEEHRCFMENNPDYKRDMLKERTEAELIEEMKDKVSRLIVQKLRNEGKLDDLLQKILERRIDPASAAEELVKKVLNLAKT